MANLLFIDIETTGLSSNASVIEIAAIAYINGEAQKPFQSYIAPHKGATLDPEAFKVNKIDIRKVWEFPDAKIVIENLLQYIDSFECSFSLAGHNVQFDAKGLYRLFCLNGEYGNYHARIRPGNTCTFNIAKEVFKTAGKKPSGFSLKKLCDHFEIKLDNAHSALPDIQATIELYEKLLPLIPNLPDQEIKVGSYQEMKRKYMQPKYVQINPEGDIWLSKDATQNNIIRRFIFTELDDLYEN